MMHKLLQDFPSVIETERLVIRRCQKGDGKKYFEIFERNNNREVLQEAVSESINLKTENDAAIKHRPEEADAWCNLGIILSREGDIEEGEKALKKAIDIRPDHMVAWMNLIQLYYRSGREQGGDEAYERARTLVPRLERFMGELNSVIDELKKNE